jgi:MYXO-CTERM domain-containing protein
MKKIPKLFSVLAFSIALWVSCPVMAQNDNSARTTQSTDYRDDDTGKWGLAGLLGLLGLLGLKRRDNDRTGRASVNR